MCFLQFSLRSRCSPRYLASSVWGIFKPFKITVGHVSAGGKCHLYRFCPIFFYIKNNYYYLRWSAASRFAANASASRHRSNIGIKVSDHSRSVVSKVSRYYCICIFAASFPGRIHHGADRLSSRRKRADFCSLARLKIMYIAFASLRLLFPSRFIFSRSMSDRKYT